ncbi:hypothetical protein GBAR_LOCUS25195, partial [Geodia barretti]
AASSAHVPAERPYYPAPKPIRIQAEQPTYPVAENEQQTCTPLYEPCLSPSECCSNLCEVVVFFNYCIDEHFWDYIYDY